MCPSRDLHLSGCIAFPFHACRSPVYLSFRLWDSLLVHLDWALNGYCAFSFLKKRRKPLKAKGWDGESKGKQRPRYVWMTCDVSRDGGRDDLTTIPFPCAPFRDMQIFQVVAVGRRVNNLPETSQNLKKISPCSSPISIISGFKFQHCHVLLL